MNWKITETQRVVSPAGGTFWVQVHDFTPNDEEERKKRGRLVALLGVRGESGDETMQMVGLGREVLAFLHEQYYGNTEGGILERLKKGLESLQNEFGDRVEVAVLVDSEDVLYAGMGGGCRIYGREGETCGFVGGDEENRTRVFSLWKKTETTLVLGTASFWEKFGEGRIRGILESEKSVAEISEELAVVVGSGEEGSGIGAVIVRLDEKETENIVEVETGHQDEEIFKAEKEQWKFAMPNFLKLSRSKSRDLGKVAFGQTGGRYKLIIIMLVIMIALVTLGEVKKRIGLEDSKGLNTKIVELEQRISEIDLLVEVNPTRAREEIAKIQGLIEELGKSKNEKARSLVLQAITLKDRAWGLLKIDFKEAIDLSLLREGMKAEVIKKTAGGLVILDAASGRLVNFDTDKEKGEVVLGGEEMSGVRFVTTYPGFVYLVGNNGIRECIVETWKCSNKVSGADVPPGIIDVSSWAGNIYVLDSQEGRVWKYQKTNTGFEGKSSWMSTDQKLVGAQNMAIDGQVWTTLLGGEIGKYNRGVAENFEVLGSEKVGLGKIAYIYTSGDEEKLYVLDSENRRILVIKKSGEFEKQLISDVIAQATSLVVYEDKAKIYLSSGSKIYQADLP